MPTASRGQVLVAKLDANVDPFMRHIDAALAENVAPVTHQIRASGVARGANLTEGTDDGAEAPCILAHSPSGKLVLATTVSG